MFNKYPYTDFHELNLDWFLEEFSKTNNSVKTLEETVATFTAFVTNYFDNLDVQTEINNKLNQMAADGELQAMLEPYFTAFVQDTNDSLTNVNSRINSTNIKVESLESRMDSFVHLEAGSTTGDAELIDARIEANGTVASNAGNAIRQQANRLNLCFDTNPFLQAEILQGSFTQINNYLNPQPNTSSVRIRTEFQINCSKVEVIIPPTKKMSYTLFDSYGNVLTQGLAINYDGLSYEGTDINTLRFNFKHADDSTIVVEDIDDVIVKIDDNYVKLSEIQTVVKTNQADIATLKANVTGDVNTDFVQGGYGAISNYSSPNTNTSSMRIRTEFASDGSILAISNDGSGYECIFAAFDSANNVVISRTSWSAAGAVLADPTIVYVRISIREQGDASITPADFASTGITIRYISKMQNDAVKLKVMTYNIGAYSYGVAPYYLDTDYATKLANYKEFFSSEKPDLIGFEELVKYLDNYPVGTVTGDDEIYDYLYPEKYNIDGGCCLKSKFTILSAETRNFASSGRSYVNADVLIGNRTIHVMVVHFTPNAGAAEDALRAAEAAEVVSVCDSYQYAIVFGDFNAQDATFYDNFTSNGYKIANGGYLPIESTYHSSPMYLDNIITSSSITIDYAKALDVYDDLSSDHIPLIAYLTIK